MVAPQHRQKLLRLARLITEGATWDRAARLVALPKTTAYELLTAHFPALERRRRPQLSPSERQAILERVNAGRDSYSAIAREFRRSKDTVWRMARRQVDRARATAGEFQPRHRRVAVRCPSCGTPSHFTPCVACAARGAKRDVA